MYPAFQGDGSHVYLIMPDFYMVLVRLKMAFLVLKC